MVRSRSISRASVDLFYLDKIRKIKSNHPYWGYRRVWSYLTYVEKRLINRKRVYRLMKENKLLVTKSMKFKAQRTHRPKPKAQYPSEIWGIDMTKVKTDRGWAYVILVVDWFTKKIVGARVDELSRTEEWKQAIEQAVQRQCIDGSRAYGIKLVSDNGCQPTSKAFMKHCNHLGLKQIFTSFCNPKGNAETERMIRTLKEELIWLKEWEDLYTLKAELNEWVEEYNQSYLHSALGYMSPENYERKWHEEKYLKKA